MDLTEARRILETQDDSDPVKSLEAIAMVLRFNAISDPRLLKVTAIIEQVAGEMKDKE